VYDALEWWFIGDQPDEDYPDGGGFHTSVGFQSYCNSDMSDAYVGPGEMADNPSSIQELLDAGFALGVQLKGDEGGNDGSHVFTIWGYSVETNDPGLMTGVFITNSDDDKNKDNPPDRLYYRQVVFFGDAWHILEEDGSPYKYIKFVYGLSQK
jgi:hypothetical protein